MNPFIIYALPRSRTAWLSAFLTYRDWVCGHETAMYFRNIQSIGEFFAIPNTGTVETAAAPAWPIIVDQSPNIKQVVILRPVDEVVDAIMNLDVGPDFYYDKKRLEDGMRRGDRTLRKLASCSGVVSIDFSDLNNEDTCAAIFEYCLPFKFDRNWYLKMKDINVQADVKSVLRYCFQHKAEIDSFKSLCRSELWRISHHRRAA